MADSKPNRTRRPDLLGLIMIAAITLLNLIGMYAAIYVDIPDGSNGWTIAMTSFSIMSHTALGTILVVVGILHLIQSVRSKIRAWILPSAVGLIAVFGAMTAGSIFLSALSDTYTVLMAACSAVAVIAYAFGLYLSGRQER